MGRDKVYQLPQDLVQLCREIELEAFQQGFTSVYKAGSAYSSHQKIIDALIDQVNRWVVESQKLSHDAQ